MFARADIACSSPMSVEDIRRGLFPNASFSSRAAVHLYAPSASPGCTKRTSGQPHFCLRIQAYARCFMQRRKPAISAWEYRHWARIIASVDLSVRLLRSWRTLTCLDRLSMRSQLRPPRRQRARGLFIFNAPARAYVPRAANAATRANIAERFGWKGLKASGTDSDLSHRLPEADGTPHEQ
jgi:hypothetical protein